MQPIGKLPFCERYQNFSCCDVKQARAIQKTTGRFVAIGDRLLVAIRMFACLLFCFAWLKLK